MDKYDYLSTQPQPDPKGWDLANEMTASFVPGLGQVQALRDYLRAEKSGDRLGQVLSALGTVPGVGAAVKGATSLASFVPLLGARSKEATKLLEAGASSDELWSKLRALRVPRRPKDTGLDDRFLTEIDDSKARFKVPLLSRSQKEQAVERIGGDPLQQASALRRAESMNIPVPGNYQMQDLIDHPELYNQVAALRTMPIRVGFDPKLVSRGQYTPKTNQASLNLAAHLTADTPGMSGVLGTALHEGGHAIQHWNNLSGGASPTVFRKAPEVWDTAAEGLSRAGSLDPRTRQQWERLLRLKNEPFRLYREAPGEQLSRATQDRLHLSDAARDAFDPSETSFTSLHSAVDPMFAHHMLSAAEGVQKQNADPAEIARLLRTWGTIK